MKYILWILGACAVVGLLVVAVTYRPMTESSDSNPNSQMPADGSTVQSETTPPSATAAGRYQAYGAELVDDAGYATTILFFYAGWCPECRAYDKAITAGSLPVGVQILKVDYDDAQDLRQKYGVTIQSTFVRVNASGEKQVLWNGYGREKSSDIILENTK